MNMNSGKAGQVDCINATVIVGLSLRVLGQPNV